MHVLVVSPFHGNSSHAAWAHGLQAHSRHRVSVVGLDARAWRWRLKGGAVPLAAAVERLEQKVDVMIATSLTCLTGLFGLVRRSPLAQLPTVYYMHENQLAYPIRPEGRRDEQLVLRQFHSQLAADQVWFNSDYNRRTWFKKLPGFLSRFPDHNAIERIPELEGKSRVLPLGLDLPPVSAPPSSNRRPVLLWNQRWEWDKGIDRLLSLVGKFGSEGAFDVVLLGEEPSVEVPTRQELVRLLGPRLLHSGWCDRETYWAWLEKASFTVSTARHEFFGLSLLEAAACGVMVFLPDGLSYPELFPPHLKERCFYRSYKGLYRMVREFLQDPEAYRSTRLSLQIAAREYSWERVVGLYDAALEELVKEAPRLS